MTLEAKLKRWPVADANFGSPLGDDAWEDSTFLLINALIKGVVACSPRAWDNATGEYTDVHRIRLYDPEGGPKLPALQQAELDALPHWRLWFDLVNEWGPSCSGATVTVGNIKLYKISYAKGMGHTPLNLYFFLDPQKG